jgi:tyrosyl-tRNA synthetase
LDFEGENAAEIVNNYDWFKNFSYLGFLREVGKHLTISYMTAKDSVQKRLETGLSYTEFSYQLLQAYDFFYLNQHKGVRLQMGGSDQWGNITSGTELIRRMGGSESFALTTPLITKSDGAKFGKSESGNIWLDAERTSPYQFYQFWLNCADEDAPKLLRVFTLKPLSEILEIEAEHAKNPHNRLMQKALAEDVCLRVHGKSALETAVAASEILFGKDVTAQLNSIDEKTLLSVFEGVPQVNVPTSVLETEVTDLLSVQTGLQIYTSKGEAKRSIQGGGVSINKIKISGGEKASDFQLLQNKYLLVQKGKKNYVLIKVED